jgi:hypothetical protein
MRVLRQPSERQPTRPLAVEGAAVNLWLANLDDPQG